MTETPSDQFDLPDPYATSAHLAGYWRTLSEGEETRATELLRWAAQLINEEPGSDNFDPTTAAMVSMDMVKRAMLRPEGDGVSETTTNQSMLDMTAAVTHRYVNPAGNLYLTTGEKARLARKSVALQGGSLTLASNVRVPREPWNQQPSPTNAST